MQIKYKVNFEFNKSVETIVLHALTGFGANWPALYDLYSDKNEEIFKEIGQRLEHINQEDQKWWCENIQPEVISSDCDSTETIKYINHDKDKNFHILTIDLKQRPTEKQLKNASQRFKYYMNEVVPAILEVYMEKEIYNRYLEEAIGVKIGEIDSVKLVGVNIEEEITISVKHNVEI